LADDASPGAIPGDALAGASVAVIADAAIVIVAATAVTNPIIWPGGASNRLGPPRLVRLRHRHRRGGHRPVAVRSFVACSTTDRTVPSASARHCSLTLSAHRFPLRYTHPIVRSNLRACTQVRRGCHRVCKPSHAPRGTAAWLSPQP
jgi:hypothetical protein